MDRGFGDDTVSERIAQNLFSGFRFGDNNLNDGPTSGRLSGIDSEGLRQPAWPDSHQTALQVRKIWANYNQIWLSNWGHLELCLGFSSGPTSRQCCSTSAVSRLPFCCSRSGILRLCSTRTLIILSTSGRGAHPVSTLRRHSGLSAIRKSHAVNLVKHQRSVALWTVAAQLQHHCAAVQPTPGMSARSKATQGPESQPYPLPVLQSQTVHRNTIHQQLLEMGWEVFIQALCGPELALPTVICSCLWALPFNMGLSPTRMTWLSGWNIFSSLCPNPFIVMTFKICSKNCRKWSVGPMVTLIEWSSSIL